MKIVCPECRFTREVPENRLPGAAAIATCPQCGHRFRVRRPEHNPEAADWPQNSPSHDAEQDDPLPPGAVIPKTEFNADPAPPSAQEDDDYRRTAVAAYRRQADQGEEPEGKKREEELPTRDEALENPWEHPERDGYAAAFYQTTVRVMFAAPRFFAGLRADAPQTRSLWFYLLVSLCQILVERFWSETLSGILASSAADDPQLQKLIQMLTPQTNLLMALLLRTAMTTLELFVAAGLYFLMFRLIAPAQANYQLIFQVLAYSSAPALLCVAPVVGSVAGFIWGVACSFVGCRYALKLTWRQTILGLAPIYALGIPFALRILQSVQTAMG